MVLPFLFTGDRGAGPVPSQVRLDDQIERELLGCLHVGTYNRDSQQQTARLMEMLEAADRRGNEVMQELLGDGE
ncbi:hypothetical protein GS483_08955 [Rhodococcus hoagii]|nr:hypothetical protein [Prescottella equi]